MNCHTTIREHVAGLSTTIDTAGLRPVAACDGQYRGNPAFVTDTFILDSVRPFSHGLNDAIGLARSPPGRD